MHTTFTSIDLCSEAERRTSLKVGRRNNMHTCPAGLLRVCGIPAPSAPSVDRVAGTHTPTQTHTHIHTHKHTNTQTHKHMHTHTYTRTHTHTHMHTHTRHTHTYAYTCAQTARDLALVRPWYRSRAGRNTLKCCSRKHTCSTSTMRTGR